jgi:acetyltransferase-like isoleucine patch superfamily enzyme
MDEARTDIHRHRLKSCGADVSFQHPVWINQPEMVELGNRTSLGMFVHIWGAGGVKIGERVMVGSHTAISTVTHDHRVEDMFNSLVTAPIVLEDNVWVGTHAVILPGVTIGRGAVVAAGCVVTKDVPARAIVAGVPGRIVSHRPDGGDAPQAVAAE